MTQLCITWFPLYDPETLSICHVQYQRICVPFLIGITPRNSSTQVLSLLVLFFIVLLNEVRLGDCIFILLLNEVRLGDYSNDGCLFQQHANIEYLW